MLKRFREPPWNNPVVRVIDAAGTLLSPRVNNDWTLAGITRAMVKGLKATKRVVPPYLMMLANEALARKRGAETVVFGMS